MKKSVWFGTYLIGFSSILAQIVVLREALAGFYGNELIIGIVLANWLLLTGIGTYLGKKSDEITDKINVFAVTQIFIAVLTPLMIFLIRVVRSYVFTPGEIISFIPIITYSLIILSPFCIVSGFQFTLASSIASQDRKEKAYCVSNVYIVDCLGHLSGGFLFSFVLVYFLDSFQALSIVVSLALFSAWLLAKDQGNKKLAHVTSLTLIAFLIFFASIDLETLSTQLQFPGQKLIHQENSRYGKLVVTETEGQLNFYENAFPLFTTENKHANEEKVHYAMLQHSKPQNILLISGGVSGTTAEVMTYNPERLDYVELDPKIIEVGRTYTKNLGDDRIQVYNRDGRLHVKQTDHRYDVVIIDLPNPSSVQINRFYTLEFLEEVKKVLNPGGVLSLSLSGGDNYLNDEAKNLNSAVYQTLTKVFGNVLIVPGTTNYFMASDSELSYDYVKKLREKNIKTKYFEYYITGVLTEDRIEYMYDAVKEKIRLNRDFTPISHFYYFLYWMSVFKVNYSYILILVVIVSLAGIYVSRIEPIPFTIFVTGFSAMALELVLLVSFQILYGYVYHKIGLIVTAFMLGNILGAHYVNKSIRSKHVTPKTLSKFDFALFAYCLVLPAVLLGISRIQDPILISLSAEVVIPALTLAIGVLVGVEFPIAMKTYLAKSEKTVETAGVLYSVDLFGACIGALLLSVILIPFLGILKVTFFVGFLNLASGLYIWFKEK